VRFGRWPPPHQWGREGPLSDSLKESGAHSGQRGAAPAQARVPPSMTGGSPWVWGALPTKSTSGASQEVAPEPLGYMASRQEPIERLGKLGGPAAQDWVNGLRDAPCVCVGLHMPRHARRVLPLLNAEPPWVAVGRDGPR
jgi:hypothetical protein